uniref:Uncharacterized protein n=1 Tax=Octactis speculum TaxID=3111310 RepID=A0A7S2DN27_9STRA
MRHKKKGGGRVVLDRCNATVADRAKWLQLAMTPADATAVHFTAGADVCKQRVMNRVDHPTIPFGTGERIVDTWNRQFVAPTEGEGFRRVIRVSSISEANALLRSWGGGLINPAAAIVGGGGANKARLKLSKRAMAARRSK